MSNQDQPINSFDEAIRKTVVEFFDNILTKMSEEQAILVLPRESDLPNSTDMLTREQREKIKDARDIDEYKGRWDRQMKAIFDEQQRQAIERGPVEIEGDPVKRAIEIIALSLKQWFLYHGQEDIFTHFNTPIIH